MAFVGHFFSELQKCFQLALFLLDMFLDHVRHKSYMSWIFDIRSFFVRVIMAVATVCLGKKKKKRNGG